MFVTTESELFECKYHSSIRSKIVGQKRGFESYYKSLSRYNYASLKAVSRTGDIPGGAKEC